MKRIKSGEQKQYTLNISQILVTVPIQIKSQIYESLLSVRMIGVLMEEDKRFTYIT